MTEEIKKLINEEVQPAVASLRDEVKGFTKDVDKVRQALEDFKAENGKALKEQHDEIMTKLNRQTAPSPDEEKKAKVDEYEVKFADYLRKGTPLPEEFKTMSTDVNTAGGYLMPQNQNNRITELAVQYAPMMDLAEVITISQGDSIEFPKEGSTAFSVSIQAEGATRSATTSGTLAMDTIYTYIYEANPLVTNKLLADSAFPVEPYINKKIAEQIGVSFMGDCVTGTGTGEPTGFTVTTNANSVLSGSSAALAIATVPKLALKVKPQYRRNGKWACNGTTLGVLWGLDVAAYGHIMSFNPGSNVFTICGQDCIEMSELADIGASAYPLWYGDFNAACKIVKRQDINVLRNPYLAPGFTYFYTTTRLGFLTVLPEALAKMKSNNS